MTLLQKFSFICLVAFFVFGASLGFIITNSLEHFMIEESKQTTAAHVIEEVRHEFRPEDFRSAKTGDDYDLFSGRIKHLTFGKNVERIKIWGIDGTVLWADSRDAVGLKFSDNRDLQEATSGRIVSGISSLSKLEHASEKGHGKLLELYVPVSFNNGARVDAVFEIYQNVRDLSLAIDQRKRLVWKSIAGGFSLLYITLFGIVWRASKRIDLQHQEIVRSQAKYRSLVRSAHDGIISVDKSGGVVLFNDAAERMFGQPVGSILGKSVRELIQSKDHEVYQAAQDACMQCGDAGCGDPLEVGGLRRDGTAFPMEVTLSVSEADNGLMVTGFVRDISERKAMQAQLVQSEKMATVSVIAGSIGHEINNILSSLLGYSELLLEREGNDELTTKCAEVFSSQTQRLNLHANNLLALGRPQKPEMKEIPLHRFLDRVTDLLEVSGMFKLCTLVRRYAGEEIVVIGDEMLLEQVVRNLQINALHAMEKQGIITMATTISSDKQFAEISFADTGHGIKDSIRHQIFLPFYTTKETGKGTGLGLYIVKQIVEQHGGYIRLDSEEGRGTTVLIGLPLRSAA
ncbi:MAG: PAS domain S-box protein [Nitrospirae bacterium]|nr:MAG: PAS domain S-box protein [Nitrospirota bacterium]